MFIQRKSHVPTMLYKNLLSILDTVRYCVLEENVSFPKGWGRLYSKCFLYWKEQEGNLLHCQGPLGIPTQYSSNVTHCLDSSHLLLVPWRLGGAIISKRVLDSTLFMSIRQRKLHQISPHLTCVRLLRPQQVTQNPYHINYDTSTPWT